MKTGASEIMRKYPEETRKAFENLQRLRDGIQCTCLTKTPEAIYHSKTCPIFMKYKIENLEKDNKLLIKMLSDSLKYVNVDSKASDLFVLAVKEFLEEQEKEKG